MYVDCMISNSADFIQRTPTPLLCKQKQRVVRLAKSNTSLFFQKEEEITQLEVRLRKRGVPMENIRRISMGTKRPDTIPESSPRLKIRGDRYAFVSGGAEKESNELFPSCLLALYQNESSRKTIYIPCTGSFTSTG